MYDIKMLKAKKLAELIEIAEQIGLKDIKGMKKQDLIDAITKNPDQETRSVETNPQFEENKQNIIDNHCYVNRIQALLNL